MRKIFLVIAVFIINSISYSQDKPNYPLPNEGFKRVDLLLPKLKNQENIQVEVKFAFEIELLDCERGSFHLFPNLLTEKFGIGTRRFPYHVIQGEDIEIMAGRNGDCNDVKKMKMIYSDDKVIYNYQSSYAVPFYIPKNWNLVYRVWSTTENYTTVK